MTTIITMTDQARALFRLMTWLSPAFPIGAFSFSHGLEWAAESGLVHDEASLENWISAGLAREFGPVNGHLLCRAWESIQNRDATAFLDALAESRALVATSEFELETTAQGGAFFSTLRQTGLEFPAMGWAETLLAASPGPLPLAFVLGLTTAAASVPLELALTAFFQAMTGNVVSAALRLMRLGQTAGQRILARLEPAVIAAARNAMHRPAADVGAAMPVLELCSILHETQYTRLFRS
jgi:urease accessory protein